MTRPKAASSGRSRSGKPRSGQMIPRSRRACSLWASFTAGQATSPKRSHSCAAHWRSRRRSLAANPPRSCKRSLSWPSTMRLRDRMEDAEAAHRRVIANLEARLGGQHPAFAGALYNLAEARAAGVGLLPRPLTCSSGASPSSAAHPRGMRSSSPWRSGAGVMLSGPWPRNGGRAAHLRGAQHPQRKPGDEPRLSRARPDQPGPAEGAV